MPAVGAHSLTPTRALRASALGGSAARSSPSPRCCPVLLAHGVKHVEHGRALLPRPRGVLDAARQRIGVELAEHVLGPRHDQPQLALEHDAELLVRMLVLWNFA